MPDRFDPFLQTFFGDDFWDCRRQEAVNDLAIAGA